MGAAAAVPSRTIVSPFELREDYKRQQNRLTLFFAFVLTSGLLVWIWLIATGFVVAHPWLVSGVLFALLLPLLYPILRLLLMYRRRVAISDANEDDLGPYSRELLSQIVDDVRATYPARVHPEVFLLRPGFGSRCSAMSIRSLFLRFVPAFNVVYLSCDLMDILRPDELRAVLAHEFAHFHGLNNLPGRAFISTHMAIAAFILAVLALCPWLAAAGFLAQVSVVAVTGYLFRRAVILPHNRLYRDEELLADLEASLRYGQLATTNAFLRISDRAEVISDVTLRALLTAETSSNPLAFGLMQDCLDALPRGEVSKAELDRLMSSRLAEKRRALDERVRKLSPFKLWLAHRLQWLGRRLTRHMLVKYWNHSYWQKIDWHCFDTIRVDGALDQQELPAFIRELERNTMSGVMLTPGEQEAVLRPVPNRYRHPSIRTRILSLNKAHVELSWRAAGYRITKYVGPTLG